MEKFYILVAGIFKIDVIIIKIFCIKLQTDSDTKNHCLSVHRHMCIQAKLPIHLIVLPFYSNELGFN